MIVSTCRLCGGDIGSHSDLCGSCGFDPYSLSEGLRYMKNYILHAIAGLICFVAGLGLQVNVDRTFVVSLGEKEGEPVVIKVEPAGQKYRASWDLIQYNDHYRTKTGKTLTGFGL